METDSSWEFVPRIDSATLKRWFDLENALFYQRRIRCRVVLKGNAILSEEDTRPLDGDVLQTEDRRND